MSIVNELLKGNLTSNTLTGLSDPYVKGHLAQYRFRTQVQRKTLSPKWQEEFKVPICSWDGLNILAIEVLDKDRFSVDDIIGLVFNLFAP